jgi:hypothetical protein
MALNKLKFNSLNVTPTAGKTVGFNSDADGLEATFSGGAMTFIKKLTASSSSTLSFVDGSSSVVLDNTYKEYLFIFKDIHPGTNSVFFEFNLSIDSGSNYNVTKTSTAFRAYHAENDSGSALSYITDYDLAQSTSGQVLQSTNLGAGNDECFTGFIHLFNPSSTTFVKHYMAETSISADNDGANHFFTAGYGNTTSAVDAIQFKMNSGNIESGTITLYGIN